MKHPVVFSMVKEAELGRPGPCICPDDIFGDLSFDHSFGSLLERNEMSTGSVESGVRLILLLCESRDRQLQGLRAQTLALDER